MMFSHNLSPRFALHPFMVLLSSAKNRLFVVQAGLVPIMVKYLLATNDDGSPDMYLRNKATAILRNLGGEDDLLLEKEGMLPP